MFASVLVANRGEIAARIMRTCARLGLRTVAVYSEADRGALHVRHADEAVLIGPARSLDSYLDIERVINAAHFTGAEAVHPGYGFLAENAEFARACAAAGLTFIGPSPETMEAMGSKSEAKRVMEAAGVPTIPGYHGARQADVVLEEEARRIGFPVIIKPSAGGGGKGMRIVRSAEHFAGALAGARREAASAFGDDALLIEKFIERPRHIEFQIFGDRHGNVIHLHERECSVQRRYQKIIEETPSPFLDADLAARMGDAAVASGRAVDYAGAGTVEFIVTPGREFYFMEMNTRLQVEHPVTEMTTGLDLVEWQLRVAAGEPLPLSQADVSRSGHAIEARIYAEDPDNGFIPSTGTVRRFAHPRTTAGLRLDSAVSNGDEVSIHYDPMIAKLIVHEHDRDRAIGALRQALAASEVFGLKTNLDLLLRIASDERFRSGEADTGYIDRHLDDLLAAGTGASELALLGAACSALDRRAPGERLPERRVHHSPWHAGDAWQANGRTCHRIAFSEPSGSRHVIALTGGLPRFEARIGDRDIGVHAVVRGQRVVLESDGQSHVLRVLQQDRELLVTWPGPDGPERTRLALAPLYPVATGDVADDKHPGSPMPGRIVVLHVSEGDEVTEGQALLVLEGMKMEYTLQARTSGTVATLRCKVGDMVDAEVPLVDIEATGD